VAGHTTPAIEMGRNNTATYTAAWRTRSSIHTTTAPTAMTMAPRNTANRALSSPATLPSAAEERPRKVAASAPVPFDTQAVMPSVMARPIDTNPTAAVAKIPAIGRWPNTVRNNRPASWATNAPRIDASSNGRTTTPARATMVR